MATQTEKIEIKIGGKHYDAYKYMYIKLTQELLKPNELCFTMKKINVPVSEDDCSFTIPKTILGLKVTLKIVTSRFDEYASLKNETLEFTGIIFNVNIYREAMDAEQVIEVQAFSPDYLLMDHPHCMSYEDKTLHEIVNTTLAPYDIPKEIAVFGETSPIKYIVQYNETNYEFLVRLAKLHAQWMYYDGEKLVFGELNEFQSFELKPDTEVLNYRFNTRLLHRAIVHGFHNYADVYENQTNSHTKLNPSSGSSLKSVAQTKSKALFTKETFINAQSVKLETEPNEGNTLLLNQLFCESNSMVICTGKTVRADLRLFDRIKIIDKYGIKKEKQEYYSQDSVILCRLVHTVDNDGNYENEFSAMLGWGHPPYFTEDFPRALPQRAKVMDNLDPQFMGRIRVQFLWQEEQNKSLMTPWIRIAQPHGGNDKGFHFIPEIGEEVMVDFEYGNAEKPYVVGTLWHRKHKPGLTGDSFWAPEICGYNEVKAIRTRNGHTIEIHDKNEDGYIRIYDNEKENYILTFSTDEKLIKLQSKGNIELYADNDIILDAKRDIKQHAKQDIVIEAERDLKERIQNTRDSYIKYGDTLTGDTVTITAAGHISINAGSDITTEAGGDINTKAGGDIGTEAGGDINTEAGGDICTNAGGNIEMNAGGDMSLAAGGSNTISGSTVDITGSPVNIN